MKVETDKGEMMRLNNYKLRGVSLVELMITLAVIAIVATIATPSYLQYVRKSHRTEAKSFLLSLAAEQEKYVLENNAYATTLDELGITAEDLEEKRYNYTLSSTQEGADFLLTADAGEASPQYPDKECRSFTIDQTGEKTATNSENAETTEGCWR